MSDCDKGHGDLVRISRFVLFIDYGHEVEIQHTVRGSTRRVPRSTYDALMKYRAFRSADDQAAGWIDPGILVRPFSDAPQDHGGLRANTEARIAHDYGDWYWQREVEAERDYKWLGRHIVKMLLSPTLFHRLRPALRRESPGAISRSA